MNKISNMVFYHDFIHSLNKQTNNDMLGNIKEYVCGDSLLRSEDFNCFEKNVGELRTRIAEYNIENCKVETYVGEQGNICFFTKLLVEGVTYLAIPLNLGEGAHMFACPDRLDMGTESNIVLVEACNMRAHLDKLLEECEDKDSVTMIHDIIRRIPEDTGVKMIAPTEYENRLKATFGDDFAGLPEDSYKGGFGMYLSVKDTPASADLDDETRNTAPGTSVDGLFYDMLTPEIFGSDVFSDSNGCQLLCCNNENYREFMIFEDDELRNTDTIEEYFLVNPTSILRDIDVLLMEANVAREVRKNTTDIANPEKVARGVEKALDTDVGARRAAAVPKEFYKKVKELNIGLRGFVANWRRAHDDQLREKLYNDEFIPLIDDVFELLISGATGYGVVAVGLVGPLAGIVIGIGVFIFANWRQKVDRKRILELLDDKIKLLEEEIDDAKLDSDLVTKRQLIQIKTQLERKRAKITVGNSLGSR